MVGDNFFFSETAAVVFSGPLVVMTDVVGVGCCYVSEKGTFRLKLGGCGGNGTLFEVSSSVALETNTLLLHPKLRSATYPSHTNHFLPATYHPYLSG